MSESSVGEFVEFLGGQMEDAPLIGFSDKHPTVASSDGTVLSEVDQHLVRYLFRGCREVTVHALAGGFSGNAVLATKSVDLHGHEQVPHVVKIGDRGPIGQERTAFERIEAVLGNAAPRVADFAELLPGYMHVRFTNSMIVQPGDGDAGQLVERTDDYYVYLKPHAADDAALARANKFPGKPPLWIPMPPH